MSKSLRAVTHEWVGGVRESRTGCGNVWYEKDVFFSYRTAIAARFFRKDETLYIVDTHRYSVSTAKHQSLVRAAIGSRKEVLADIGDLGKTVIDPTSVEKLLVGQVHEELRKLSNSRLDILRILARVRFLEGERKTLCDFFGWKYTYLEVDENLYSERIAKARAREVALQEKREARRHADMERYRRWSEENAMKWQDWVEKFRAGKNVGFRRNNDVGELLRIHPDKPEVVQTSLAAEVPLEHVRKAARFILAKMREGGEWTNNGHSIHLGNFRVESIKNGELKVGCHTFKFGEVERFAKEIGLEC